MPKDLARADYVNEFIDLLEKHAPTSRSGKPAQQRAVAARLGDIRGAGDSGIASRVAEVQRLPAAWWPARVSRHVARHADRAAVGRAAIAAAFEHVVLRVVDDHLRRRPGRRLRAACGPALELRDRVGREAEALVVDHVGQPLVVEAAGVDRFLRVHAEVDHVEDRLEHGVDDGAAARACR